MKKVLVLLSSSVLMLLASCSLEKPMSRIIDESLSFAVKQYTLMAEVMMEKPDLLPRTIDPNGNLVTAGSGWWTSGFFPGSLWYLYEFSGEGTLRENAAQMTLRIEKEKDNRGSHDLGFMLYSSFGNGFRLSGNESYTETLLTGARSLATRYSHVVGCIKSWNSTKGWQFPVIIDNMMNLEFLMWAFHQTGDSSFYNICVKHSDTTIKNHFRPDYSTYHVVSYDTITGDVEIKQTHQGASDESMWARGQSWGLYGYVVMYRETGLRRYLDQAVNMAEFMINHPNMPGDMIPYWDYNAPGIPDARRDASAGAIMASALIELSMYTDHAKKEKFLKVAEKQLRMLASPAYLAKTGENGNFILMHSVGSLPANSEVDVPLTYADYYFIEALLRFRALL